VRLKEALNEKKVAEKELGEIKGAKEAVESERDAYKEEVDKLKKDLADANTTVDEGRRALAVYFDNGFKRATEQVLFFNPTVKVDGLDSFKIIVDGQLVDEE